MIRKALTDDIPRINELLLQVHKVHADCRPDIFKEGKKKYTDEELVSLMGNDKTPIYVYEEDGTIFGYAFCIIQAVSNNISLQDRTTIYIDDICVDSNVRGKGIGRKLFEYVKEIAKAEGYDGITLNVWECNEGAMRFYQKLGMIPLKTVMEYKIEKQ